VSLQIWPGTRLSEQDVPCKTRHISGMEGEGKLTVWTLLLKILISLWLVTVALWDASRSRIPNWLTLPVMLAAGGYGLWRGQWSVLLAWALLFLLWEMHILGGGDAKLIMGLYALFPERMFVLMLLEGILITRLPYLTMKYAGRPIGELARGGLRRLRADDWRPTHAELQRHGRSIAWTYCLPGMVYLWLLW